MPGSAVTTRKHQPGSILARQPLSESSRSAKSCSAPSGFSFTPPWPSTCARRDRDGDEEGAQSIFYGRAARRLHVHRAIIAETGRGNFWQSGRSVSRVEVQTGKLPPTRLLRKSISAKLRQICSQQAKQATPPTFRKSLRKVHKQDPVCTSPVPQLHLLFWFPWLNLLNGILDAKERSNWESR